MNEELLLNGHKTSKIKLVQQIRNNYPIYHKFTMSFQFTGLINGDKHYYIGELKSQAKQNISLVLREPILHSPLVTLSWTPKRMILKDELKNKQTGIKLGNRAKLNLLGQKIHPKIIFELIQGLCGLAIQHGKIAFNKKNQSFEIKYFDSLFITKFGKFGELKQLLVKEAKNNKITIVDISSHFWYDQTTGKIKNRIAVDNKPNLGSFYKKIHIYNNYSENYFIIEGTKFTINFNE